MEVTLASVLNLASVAGLWYLAGCLNKETAKLKEIKKAKVFSPGRLFHQLARPEFLASLKRSSENPDEYSLKAFIEGYTECDKPFQSLIDEKTKLVLSLYFKDDIYSNDSLAKLKGMKLPKDDTLEIRAPLHFNLKDPNRDDKCQVHRNSNVKAKYALEKIAESREYKNLNWFEKILVYIGLLLELIAVVTRTAIVFRGIKIGWAENEYGIILGNALTAYGKIVYNIKEHSLRMDNPQYFVHDKLNIVKKLKKNIYTTQMKMGLLLIPFIMTSVFLVKKMLHCYRKLRRRRMEQRLDKLWKTKSVKMKDDYKCIVCFDRPRNIIAKPCLHFSLCSLCYNQLDKKSCPVCKKAIMDVIEVYVT